MLREKLQDVWAALVVNKTKIDNLLCRRDGLLVDLARDPWPLYVFTIIALMLLTLLGSWLKLINVVQFFVVLENYRVYYLLIVLDAIVLFFVSIQVLGNYKLICEDFSSVFDDKEGDRLWREASVPCHSLACAITLGGALFTLIVTQMATYVFLIGTTYFIYCLSNKNIMLTMTRNRSSRINDEKYYKFLVAHGNIAVEENQPAFYAYSTMSVIILAMATSIRTSSPSDLEAIKAFAAGAAVVHFYISMRKFREYVKGRRDASIDKAEFLHILVSSTVKAKGKFSDFNRRIIHCVKNMRWLWYWFAGVLSIFSMLYIVNFVLELRQNLL